MADLTPAFREAAGRRQEWNETLAESALSNCAARIAGSSLEWEEDEGWGMVTGPSKIFCCISNVIPIAMIDERHHDNLRGVLSKFPLNLIRFDDFHARIYSIDPAILEEAFGFPLSRDLSAFGRSPDPDSSFDNISLHDIWFRTV